MVPTLDTKTLFYYTSCGIENYSHISMNIRRGQHPLGKIVLKKKLSFRGGKHDKNEKFFFRDEYY